jgi:protein transport protein SEC24
VDVEALCNLLAKKSLDIAIKTGLDLARTRLQQTCADILRYDIYL